MNEESRERRSYLIGAVLSLALTAVSFGAVAVGLDRHAALWTIALAALVQVVVQLRFFLHIDLSRQKREDLQLILFSTLMLAMMVGGTVWILANLADRMG